MTQPWPASPLPSHSPDDGPTDSELELIARRVFEKAVALHAEERPLTNPELRKGLLDLCHAAQKNGHRAEELIVQLKRSWAALPSSAESHDRSDLVSQLISLCIREYYRT